MIKWALIDCNNFFASCERVFRPDLENVPIAVLSNNDGCIIARSNEVKQMGVPMGAPLFKFKDILKKNKVKVFSANFSLYGDISNRILQILSTYDENLIVYSIDEAFLNLERKNFVKEAINIKKDIKRSLGVPVSIGIGSTKTLAKLATIIAKKEERTNGVFSLIKNDEIESILAAIDVQDIWGIGAQTTKMLYRYGIFTAWDFKQLPDKWIKSHFNISILRTAWELRGIPCIDLICNTDTKKGILSSRSFVKGLVKFADLESALSNYVGIAAEKLRAQCSSAGYMGVFLRGKDKNGHRKYYNIGHKLRDYTSFTPELIEEMVFLLNRIYKTGITYKKAGIWLSDLRSDEIRQSNIFSSPKEYKKQLRIMNVVDRVNKYYGRNMLQIAVNKRIKKSIKVPEYMSPQYTTRWDDLPKVKI